MKVFFPSSNCVIVARADNEEGIKSFCANEEVFSALPEDEYYIFVLGNVSVLESGFMPVSEAKVVNVIEEEGKQFVIPIASKVLDLRRWAIRERTLAQDYMDVPSSN